MSNMGFVALGVVLATLVNAGVLIAFVLVLRNVQGDTNRIMWFLASIYRERQDAEAHVKVSRNGTIERMPR